MRRISKVSICILCLLYIDPPKQQWKNTNIPVKIRRFSIYATKGESYIQDPFKTELLYILFIFDAAFISFIFDDLRAFISVIGRE